MWKKFVNRLLTVVIVLSLCAACFFLWKIVETQIDYRKGQEGLEAIYQAMSQALEENTSSRDKDEEAAQTAPEEDPAVRLAQYQALHEQNSDMAGWIRIPDTVIDYPVMHTPEDPEYYFHRDFEKNYSSYGMIFLDGDCRLDGTSPNLVLYGHHMRNGSMFAQIQSYDDPEYWQAHPLIQFDTLEELGTYEVLGAFKAPAAELDEEFKQMLLAQTEEDYGRLMDYLEGRRFYDTGVDASYPRQLITLTTCEYTQKDGRFFVVAAKVEE